MDRDGSRPVRSRAASPRAELSPRRPGSPDQSIPVQASASACRRPGRRALDRHTLRPLPAASRRPDHPRTHGPGCGRRPPSARRSTGSGLDRPRPRAEPGGSHGAFSIAEYVAVDIHGTPALSCGSRDISLPRAPGEACRFETIAQSPHIVRSLSEGSDGRVWIGTTGGLIEFDGEGFRAYSERHGLTHETINAVAEDRAGSVWIGTDAGGVARLTRNGFVSFREQDGLRHDYVTSISQSRTGRVRAGGGWPVLNEFDGERFTSGRFSIPGRVDSARVYDVLEDHTGDFWVGTPAGLLRFPESTAWRSSLAPGRRPSIRSRTDCPSPASLRRSRIPVATSG